MANFLGRNLKPIFQLFVFLLPVQLGYHFWPKWAYIFGIRSDYLSPTVYLTDLLFVFLFFLIFKQKGWRLGKQKIFKGALVIIILAALNIAVSVNPFASFFKWIKVVEVLLVALVVAGLKPFDTKDWIVKPLALSVLSFSLIGISQVIIGRTLGGPFYYLGERTFSLSTPGIALARFFDHPTLRAYSTFSHPNSFAGFLGVSLLFMFFTKLRNSAWKALRGLAIAVSIAALFFSASAGVGVALLAVLIIYLLTKSNNFLFALKTIFWTSVVFSLIMPIFSPSILKRFPQASEDVEIRLALSEDAGQIVAKKLLLGTGLNGFIQEAAGKGTYTDLSWRLQPVHNIFLLSITELGIVGFLFFVGLLWFAIGRLSLNRNHAIGSVLIFVLLTGLLDHYWLTLQQNQLLFGLVLGLSLRKGS